MRFSSPNWSYDVGLNPTRSTSKVDFRAYMGSRWPRCPSNLSYILNLEHQNWHKNTWLMIMTELTSCTSWEFSIFWKPRIFQDFWAMSFKNHWLISYLNIYSNISFPKAVNKTCPCGVTIFTSHHKYITSSRLLQGYCIKVYQGYYVTVTLTNHRPFQNRPTLL